MNHGDHISCQGYRVRWVTTATSTDKIIYIMCLLSAPCLQFLCFYIKAAVADRHCNILRYSRLFFCSRLGVSGYLVEVFKSIYHNFRWNVVYFSIGFNFRNLWSLPGSYCTVSMMRLWPFGHILYRIIFVNVSSTSWDVICTCMANNADVPIHAQKWHGIEVHLHFMHHECSVFVHMIYMTNAFVS